MSSEINTDGGGTLFTKEEGQILSTTLETAYRQCGIDAKYPRVKTRRSTENKVDTDPITCTSPDLTDYTEASRLITQRLRARGLVYDNTPFNFGFYVDSIDTDKANQVSNLCRLFLRAVDRLRCLDPNVRRLLYGGLPQFAIDLAQLPSSTVPFIRIDMVGGKVIELGPTYVDGFATVQGLGESLGQTPLCAEILSTTISDQYQQFCTRKNIAPKSKPYILFTYNEDCQLMADELTATAEYVMATRRFNCLVQPMGTKLGNPDIVYFYGKPSMWVYGDWTTPRPDSRDLLRLVDSGNVLFLPCLNQTLGAKAALALLFDDRYQSFFTQILGQENYQDLLQTICPTKIVQSSGDIYSAYLQYGLPIVFKPSNQGSSDGVTIIKDQQSFQDFIANFTTDDEPWVAQPYQKGKSIPSLVGLRSTRSSRRREIVKIDNPTSRTVLFSAGDKCAGAFTTFSPDDIIDDGGLNVPVRLLNTSK